MKKNEEHKRNIWNIKFKEATHTRTWGAAPRAAILRDVGHGRSRNDVTVLHFRTGILVDIGYVLIVRLTGATC